MGAKAENCKGAVQAMKEFTIFGNPKALKRHRMTRKGHTYDPSAKDKNEFIEKAIQYRPNNPYKEPLVMKLVFVFQRPKAHYVGAVREENRLRIEAPMLRVKRPDIDNLVKFVADAMNGIFYEDDSQISVLEARKEYGHTPKTLIEIIEL